MFRELIVSLRPQQWYKNLVIFVAIVFSSNLLNLQMWLLIIPAFVIFCILSGSAYLVNDIVDIGRDRKHPKKSRKPIASGRLSVSRALLFAIILVIVALAGAYFINRNFLIISITYVLLALSYSLVLKHLIIVDLLAISTGFVIRAIAGAFAVDVSVSPWLIICTFLLAFCLGLGKRRHELVLLADEAKNYRKLLENYSIGMLDQMMSATTGALILVYMLYTSVADNYYMMLTIPFVIYGLFRYLFLIHTKNFSNGTEMILTDKAILICLGLWLTSILLVFYWFP